jgi:tetratricopeptide (TPR) repeat protein
MLPTWAFVILLGVVAAAAIAGALPSALRALRGTVWYARGLRAYRREQYDRALAAWHRAVEIVPWHPSAHYNLGVLHAKSGRLDEAIAEYERAVELNPRSAKAYFNLGNACLANAEYRRAARAYEAATRTPRGHARSHFNLGILYQQRLLDDDKALYHFTEYLRQGGTDQRVLNNIRQLQEKLAR